MDQYMADDGSPLPAEPCRSTMDKDIVTAISNINPNDASPPLHQQQAEQQKQQREQRRAEQLASHHAVVTHRLSILHQLKNQRISSSIIHLNDIVIVYSSPHNMAAIKVTHGRIFSNKHGHFHHDDMIGMEYGSRIYNKKGDSGYVTLLQCTPELWTLSLTHRTQILYFADISMILLQLEILPGSIVIESGTGSGSLTVSMARAVSPLGHIHTFEFNSDRVKKANEDFNLLSLTPTFITVHHRDVCEKGFPLIEGLVDAVFLDLPSPWLAISSSYRTLKHQGRFASFSPCIEQVQRVCLTLNELDFTEIRTFEVLLREYDVHEVRLETLTSLQYKQQHKQTTGITTTSPTIPNRIDRRAKRKNIDDDPAMDGEEKLNDSHRHIKRQAANNNEQTKDEAAEEQEDPYIDNDINTNIDANESCPTPEEADIDPPSCTDDQTRTTVLSPSIPIPASISTEARYPLAARSPPLSRGHTGYLTFATCYKRQ